MKHLQAIDLGRGPIFPLLIKMSTPSMAAMLVFAFYNLLDSIWLTRLGAVNIAAYTITFPFQMLLVALGIGTGVGAASYVARKLGAKDFELAQTAAGQVIFLSICLGLGLILVISLWPEKILILLGGRGTILSLARDYLSIVVWGTPFVFFINMTTNLFRAEGRPAEAMYVVFTFALLGIFLDPLLIFGLGPIPALGIKGAALAAIISQFIAATVAAVFYFQERSHIAPRLKHLRPCGTVIYSIYQTGFPSIVLNLVFGLVVTIYNRVLAPYGAHALGTLSLCFRINGLIMMVLFGIGHGVMPLVGYNFGAGLYDRLNRIVRSALLFSFCVGIISCLMILVLSRTMISLAAGDELLRSVAEPALRIFALTLVFAGPAVVWINMFIGLGRGVTAMMLLFIRDALILIPSIWLLEHIWGLKGIWLSQLSSAILGFGIIAFWARREISSLRVKT